jgi:hypothetical protein
MKFRLASIFTSLLFFYTANAQNSTLFKTWAGKNLYININKKHVTFEVDGYFHQYKTFYLKDDTLNIFEKYTSSRDNFAKTQTDNFPFLILRLNANKLVLKPLDTNAKRMSNGKRILKFIDRNTVLDHHFKFKKLKFNCSRYGSYSSITMEIDRIGNVKYIEGTPQNRSKYLFGTLADKHLQELLMILRCSQIDYLQNSGLWVSHSDTYDLRVDYNGKSKYLQRQYALPAITKELTNFLLELPKKVTWNKSEPFQITFSE